jgi:hypothetical protein
MLSAAPPPFSSSKTTSSLLRDVRVLYRRVCVLRASGKTDEGEELFSGNLAALLAQARASGEITESQLESVFASEEDRVDTAQTLAEILLPHLIAANAGAVVQQTVAPQFAAGRREMRGESSFESAPETASAEAGNTSPMLPGIADFIDEMLTQERAPSDSRNVRRPA